MNSPRTEAIHTAQEWLTLRPVYLDTETTGIGPGDEIIEIGIIDEAGAVLFESLVRPVGRVSPEAFRTHAIGDAMLSSAPRWMTVWPQVAAVLTGRAVCIYNADFDLRIIQQTHARYKMRWVEPEGASFICAMKLYAQYYGEWNSKTMNYRWQSLDNARRQCGLSLPNAHRSVADCLLTRALLHYLADQ